MPCPCALFPTLAALAGEDIRTRITAEERAKIEHAQPTDLDGRYWKAHLTIEEGFIFQFLEAEEKKRMLYDHAYMESHPEDGDFVAQHGAWEAVVFERLRRKVGKP